MIFSDMPNFDTFFVKLTMQIAKDMRNVSNNSPFDIIHTADEGPVKIQYKCLVPIYVFPEMILCSLVISKTEL
jgi:hypothetical protein